MKYGPANTIVHRKAVKLVQIAAVVTWLLALYHILIDSFITLQVLETQIRFEIQEDKIMFLFLNLKVCIYLFLNTVNGCHFRITYVFFLINKNLYYTFWEIIFRTE